MYLSPDDRIQYSVLLTSEQGGMPIFHIITRKVVQWKARLAIALHVTHVIAFFRKVCFT